MSAPRLVVALLIVAAVLGGCKSGGGFDMKNVDLGNVVKSVGNLREVNEPEEIQIGQGMMADARAPVLYFLPDAPVMCKESV